jgi:hypothetical protein
VPGSRTVQRLAAVAIVMLLAAACASTAPSPPASASAPPSASGAPRPPSAPASQTPRPTATASVGPTPAVTAAPFPSDLPGLAGWSVLNPQAVEIAVVDGSIELTLTRRALWFQGEQGVLVGQPVAGDFRVTATVEATDRAGAPLRDRTDGLVQLGGLMARADNAARENYVFIVVGTDPTGLAVETKSTTDSASRFDGPDWPTAAADLRLCRAGSTFTALKRAASSAAAWTTAATFDRPDLPDTLLVGPNIYSNGRPDLRVTIRDLRIETGPGAAACTAA